MHRAEQHVSFRESLSEHSIDSFFPELMVSLDSRLESYASCIIATCRTAHTGLVVSKVPDKERFPSIPGHKADILIT